MLFQTPLVPATLIRRYKRFLSDVRLQDGREVTAHCPNPGAMTGTKHEGLDVWLEPNDDPKKKLKYGWRLAQLGDAFVVIDTGLANRVVAEALLARTIPELSAYTAIKPEVKYGTNSRIDFLLTAPDLPDAYVEVKSVTLNRTGTLAEFPDTVTARGTKHLHDLSEMVTQGHRAYMLYLIQRTDCDAFSVAADIDPAYGAGLTAARAAGVQILGYTSTITPTAISLAKSIPYKP
jgi:sugar fermentation stimulation protein A